MPQPILSPASCGRSRGWGLGRLLVSPSAPSTQALDLATLLGLEHGEPLGRRLGFGRRRQLKQARRGRKGLYLNSRAIDHRPIRRDARASRHRKDLNNVNGFSPANLTMT